MNCPACLYPELEQILRLTDELDTHEKESLGVPDESSKYYDPKELYKFDKCGNCGYVKRDEYLEK